MTDPAKLLNEFHRVFGLPVPDEPRTLEGDELQFRETLITEEYQELLEEFEDPRWVEDVSLARQYKEAADLVYVLYGWDQHAGGLLSEVLEEVHRSNMTKLWECWECKGSGELFIGLARDFDTGALDFDHTIPCYGCNGEGRRPKYREDGKVLKSPDYQSPNIQRIIDAHTKEARHE